MPFLPIIAILAVVVGLLAAIGSGSTGTSGHQAAAPVPQATAPVVTGSVQAGAATTPANAVQAAGQMVVAQAQAPAVAPAAQPASGGAATFSTEQRKAIEQIVRDVLMNNPELLAEAQAAFEAKQEAQRAEQMKKALSENASQIFRSATAPVVGNAKGDVTVVEFFDYNCGYCKRALGDIARLIDADKKVKFVFKELPIFGRDSESAARIAIAAKKQGKYWEVHRGLLEARGKADEAKALEVAQAAGLNMDQLKKDMNAADVRKEIEDVKALAEKIGIQGTPHFFVGDKVIPGAPENLFEILSKHVAEVRKSGGCKVC